MADADLMIDATVRHLRGLGVTDVRLDLTHDGRSGRFACELRFVIDSQAWCAEGSSPAVALRRAVRVAERLAPTTVADTRRTRRERTCGVADANVGCGATIAVGERYKWQGFPPDELLPFWRHASLCLRCAGDRPEERRKGVDRLKGVKRCG